MGEAEIRLAIFDFDGTLTSGHLWKGISEYLRQHKVNRRTLYVYLLTHIPFWLLAKARLYGEEKNRSRWGEAMSVLIKGFSEAQARQAFAWVRDNYFAPLMHPDMLALMEKHRSEGDKVLLLSGMFQEFLEVEGERLGADYVIGTRLDLKDGVYSGKIIKPLCFGENKAKLLQEFVRNKKVAVDFAQSTAYADSYYDRPVFNLVGHPVAAYPDKKLLQLARANHWQTVGADQPI
jgi:HAD superfamily hydrolase (TIGR01490 family)